MPIDNTERRRKQRKKKAGRAGTEDVVASGGDDDNGPVVSEHDDSSEHPGAVHVPGLGNQHPLVDDIATAATPETSISAPSAVVVTTAQLAPDSEDVEALQELLRTEREERERLELRQQELVLADAVVQVTEGAEQKTMVVSSPSSCPKRRLCLIVMPVLVLIATGVILWVMLSQDTNEVSDTPSSVCENNVFGMEQSNFGTPHASIYHVEATIHPRLMLVQTDIAMEVANTLDCSSTSSISFHVPPNTYVVSIDTTYDDDNTCLKQTEFNIQEVDYKAIREVINAHGNPFPGSRTSTNSSSYYEQHDPSEFILHVAIPPFGTVLLELRLEGLPEKHRLGQVQVQVPFAPPYLEVDRFDFDLTSNDDGFGVDFDKIFSDVNTESIPKNASFQLHLPDAREFDMPEILIGEFNPVEIPIEGVLTTTSDESCFEFSFQPSSIQPMSRDIVFLVDASLYYSQQQGLFLASTKLALKQFITTNLNDKDTITIQTFGSRGTKDLWGPGRASGEIEDAMQFVDNIEVDTSDGTNLYEALVDAMFRSNREPSGYSEEQSVSILAVISNGQATTGETNRAKIVNAVLELNQDGNVKIFLLGFQGFTDMELLNAIATMNGGVSESIAIPQDNQTDRAANATNSTASEITTFFESEFGIVLLSDVTFSINAGWAEQENAYGVTQTILPLLSQGSRFVVRGLMYYPDLEERVYAVAQGATVVGIQEWTTTSIDASGSASYCFQKYAYLRISQLLQFRDTVALVGSDILQTTNRTITLSKSCYEDSIDIVTCIEQEALELALQAGVVVQSLTEIVSMNIEECLLMGNKEQEFACQDHVVLPSSGRYKNDYLEACQQKA